jgi:hypothetical protein
VKHIRKRFTYANVMSSIAVFLLIGGATAFAALGKNTVGTKQLKKNAVTTAKIKKEAVTAAKLKNGAVTNGKLGEGAVTGNKIAAGTIGRGNLAEAQFIPRAYALVGFTGKVQANLTNGIPNATQTGGGTYCFDLAFTPIHAQVTVQSDFESNDFGSVNIASAEGGLAQCAANNDVEVVVWDAGLEAETTEEFFLVVW